MGHSHTDEKSECNLHCKSPELIHDGHKMLIVTHLDEYVPSHSGTMALMLCAIKADHWQRAPLWRLTHSVADLVVVHQGANATDQCSATQ